MFCGSTRAARAVTLSTAVPRLTPVFTLKETVTEGSSPEWAMLCGPTLGVTLASESSGTSCPLPALK